MGWEPGWAQALYALETVAGWARAQNDLGTTLGRQSGTWEDLADYSQGTRYERLEWKTVHYS